MWRFFQNINTLFLSKTLLDRRFSLFQIFPWQHFSFRRGGHVAYRAWNGVRSRTESKTYTRVAVASCPQTGELLIILMLNDLESYGTLEYVTCEISVSCLCSLAKWCFATIPGHMSRRDHIHWTKFCSKHMSLFTFKVCFGSLPQIIEAKMLLAAKSVIALASESSGSGEEAGHRMSMSHRCSPISAMGFSPVSKIKVWAWMWGSSSEFCPIFRGLYLGVRMNCL